MDVIKNYKSICASCGCHPAWHLVSGACNYNLSTMNKRKFGLCDGCRGYLPSDNLEYLEHKLEQKEKISC